jgi:hypothetical protein
VYPAKINIIQRGPHNPLLAGRKLPFSPNIRGVLSALLLSRFWLSLTTISKRSGTKIIIESAATRMHVLIL